MGSTKNPSTPRHATKSKNSIIFAIIAYGLCSSSLLLLNKIVIRRIKHPGIVTGFQFAFAGLALQIFSALGCVTTTTVCTADVMKTYGIYVLIFMSCVYVNLRTVDVCGIETVIVAQSCSPIVVAILEFLFLGRQFPAGYTCASLMGITLGACIYVFATFAGGTEEDLEDASTLWDQIMFYKWALIYLSFISIEKTFGKQVKSSLETSLADSVYFTNILSAPLMLAWAYLCNEYDDEFHEILDKKDPVDLLFLVLSSCGGVLIGFSAWNARNVLSATSFTVVGVVNKFLTISVNLIIFPDHAGWGSIAGLVFCLISATQYKQSPLRETPYTKVTEGIEMIKHDSDLESDPSESLEDQKDTAGSADEESGVGTPTS